MKIINVSYVKDYELEITYENGLKCLFNFCDTINNFISKFHRFYELLNKEYFKNVILHEDWNTIEWENGFDICPDLMQPPYATSLIE